MLWCMSTDRPLVVSVVVADGLVGSFGLGVCAEVFGYDRRHMGLPRFDFALVTEAPGVMRTDTGIPITVEHGLERLAHSDIVSITAWELFDRVPSPVLLDAVREAYARGATIISHCTGAFVLAEAGLLDGKRVTTHWKWAGELAARYPAIQVDPSVLYVDNGRILTGAGTAAGVDTLLHLVRREWGAAAANALAREMVVPPHRDGGQAQFIDAPVAECQDDLLGAVLDWAQNHLADDLSVELLADEPAQLRPPVQGDDRDDPARLAARPPPRGRGGPARGERRAGRGGRPAGGLRHRRRVPGAVHPPAWGVPAGLPADLPGRTGRSGRRPRGVKDPSALRHSHARGGTPRRGRRA
jgi:transcriptional regulator GlxA family with amidase domain